MASTRPPPSMTPPVLSLCVALFLCSMWSVHTPLIHVNGALVRYPVCAALYIKVGSELGCQVTVNEVPPAESDEEPEANPAFTTTAVMET
jgi:hypothetical protein